MHVAGSTVVVVIDVAVVVVTVDVVVVVIEVPVVVIDVRVVDVGVVELPYWQGKQQSPWNTQWMSQ